jgi:hypothetical protein
VTEPCIVPDGLIRRILVAAEGQGFIAYKSAPRLAPPPIGWWHIAQYAGLRNRKPEHQQLAMNPSRSPQKILARHANDELAKLS